jgi:type IV pilus assembly protein PilB
MGYQGVKKKRLGEILIDEGLITEEQLENALTFQKGKNKKLGKVLIELGYISDIQVAETLTKQLSLTFVNCTGYSPPPEVLSVISKETAEKKLVFPLELNGKNLKIAMANPMDWETIEDLSFETGLNLSVSVSSENSILDAIETYYGVEEETWDVLQELPSYDGVEFVKEEVDDDQSVSLQSLYQNSEAPPIVKLVTMLIADAVKCGASDIHILKECTDIPQADSGSRYLKSKNNFKSRYHEQAISPGRQERLKARKQEC